MGYSVWMMKNCCCANGGFGLADGKLLPLKQY